MQISIGQITLIDLIDQMDRNEIVINKDYQRGSGVWPESAKTYFIDSILEGYPFPKIYMYSTYNEAIKRPIKEIVDGQQRIDTIRGFMSDKFKLTSASKNYNGMFFSDLDEEDKRKFQSYQVEFSNILSASRAELLEMFRRINAYTAPLSAAEKRHAKFQGLFKWFIVEQADDHSEILETLRVLTSKQISRMLDCEFIAELAIALDQGVVEKKTTGIDVIYKKYNEDFPQESIFKSKIDEFFKFLASDLKDLHQTFIMKSYVVHTLFCAYIHIKYGLPNADNIYRLAPNHAFKISSKAIDQLNQMAEEHEAKDDGGIYQAYVESCLSSTTKKAQRETRFKEICKSLSA